MGGTATGLLDLLLPERCAGCRAEGVALCGCCRAALRPLAPPLCSRCGAPTAIPVERCGDCGGRRLAFASARAAVAYEGPAVRIVRAWKEDGRRRLDAFAADVVVGVVPRPAADALTFVPGAGDRELWRGHNPARGLAHALAERWGVTVLELLSRAGERRRQRGLTRSERRRNAAGAFRATAATPRRVVIVDDVFTSGATASEAAAALRRAGASRVDVIAFARAQRAGEWTPGGRVGAR